MQQQTARSRSLAMESRTRLESFRASGFAKHLALGLPPAFAKSVMPEAFQATIRDAAAMAPGGAGAVRRAGIEVAPALPGDGPGSHSGSGITVPFSPETARPDRGPVHRPESDTGACYPPRRTSARATPPGPDQRYSAPMPCETPHAPEAARGDRSRIPALLPEAGTRSGNRRDVSLSPVPAPQSSRRCASATRPSRIPCEILANRQP